MGRHAASIGVFETARTMVEQLDAPLLRSMVNNNQGVALTAAGAWRDGEARYRDALSAARAAAALGHECTALRNLGECALALGEFERARPLLTEAIRLGESIGMDRVLAASTLMRASIDHATGNVPTAIAGYRAALACLERVHGDPAAQALNAIGLGIGLAESGDLEEGQRQLLEAKGYFEEVDDRVLDEALVMIRIRFAAITGERDANTAQAAIRASFQRAETLARAALSPHRLPYVRMAMLIAMRGQATPLAVEAQPADVEVLYIAADGNGFGHDGTWVALGRKANARRLLSLLATRRIDAPGTHVVLDDVFEAVWPGQRLDEPYRSNRVYVVVTQLRSAGLGGLLQHNGDGYLLCTARSVRLASAAEFAALES
ncbi:MAG: tetratricopeptide (TPR) repeat protein [Myxococcota bacterium]